MKPITTWIREALGCTTPEPARCTPDGLMSVGLGPHCVVRNTPETIDETRIRDMMPDQIARDGQGEVL